MPDYGKFLSRSAGLMRGSAIRQMGAARDQVADMVSFAAGYPADEAFPWEEFGEILAEVTGSRNAAALQYGPTPGYQPLRDVISGLMADRGLALSSDRIVVTTGSQQGLDLVTKVLLDPGDVVLLELPSYTGAIMAFRNGGVEMVGVPQQGDGIRVEDVQRTLSALRTQGRRVKLLYLIPNFQNPTGLLLPRVRRLALLEWARREEILIVEDDPYRDLCFSGCTDEDTRPMAADDGLDGSVVYLSSFSKTLAPGLRVAWIVAPAAIAEKLELAKQAADLCTGGLDQLLVYEACRRGVLARQVPRLRDLYERKCDAMVAALSSALVGRVSWSNPRGGFFLWARLAPPLSSLTLLPAARARGVVYVAGPAFYVDGSGQEYMRLSFSAPSPERIRIGVERLGQALSDIATSHPFTLLSGGSFSL